MRDAAQAPDTPKELKPAVDSFALAWVEAEAGQVAVAKGVKALAAADAVEADARRAWHGGARRLKAQLTDKLQETDPGAVAEFFPATPARKVKVGGSAGTVGIAGEGAVGVAGDGTATDGDGGKA